MSVSYPGGTGITDKNAAALESAGMKFVGTDPSTADPWETDYSDIRDAITANPGGAIGSGTAATDVIADQITVNGTTISDIETTLSDPGDDTTLATSAAVRTALGGAEDEKAKVSANDTTAGYLNGKLVAGTGIDLTEGSDGGNETLTIANDGEYSPTPFDNVVYNPKSGDATAITIEAGGQFTLADGTIKTFAGATDLDIDDDLTTDDTLAADTFYYLWSNGTTHKFSDDPDSAPSDVSGGARLRGGIYVTVQEEIAPFVMRNNGDVFLVRHQLRVPWANTGSTLPGNLRSSQLAVIGDYVYLFGGYSTDVIYRAAVSDPTSWTDTGSTLPGNLGFSQFAVIGDYVYLFGGYSTDVIYRAAVSDPTSWTDTGSTLPGNLQNSQLAVIGDYVYLFGGYTGSSTDVIYRAALSDPTSWTDTGSTLPGNLRNSQLAVMGDYVYLFGGDNTNVIYRAAVSDPTSWTDTGSTLPGNLAYSQLAVIGDYVYLFGGYTGSSTDVIYRAAVSDPTSWANTGSTLPGNLRDSQLAVMGDYVYLFGGDTSNVIYRAAIDEKRMPIYEESGSIFSELLGRALSGQEIQENKPWRLAP